MLLGLSASACTADPPPDFGASSATQPTQGPAGLMSLSLQTPSDDLPRIVLASTGRLSPEIDCHRHPAATDATVDATSDWHWHFEATRLRAGPCVDVDGKTYGLIGNSLCAPPRIAHLQDRVDGTVDHERHLEAMIVCIRELPHGPPVGTA